MKKLIFIYAIALFFVGCSVKEPTPSSIHILELENFHKVDTKLYRSAQPDYAKFKKLYLYGIRYDLNLRQFHSDKEKLQNIPMHHHHIAINTSKMSYEQLVEAVAYIAKARGKVLVHCLHGSDRTGTVVAGYRIAINGWSKKKAVNEFTNGGFGYHAFWFPNLPKLLNSLDLKEFKKDVRVRMGSF